MHNLYLLIWNEGELFALAGWLTMLSGAAITVVIAWRQARRSGRGRLRLFDRGTVRYSDKRGAACLWSLLGCPGAPLACSSHHARY